MAICRRVPEKAFATSLQGWFALSRRFISIAAVTAVSAVVALIGYAWPTPEPLLPVKPLPDRVLLENSAGKVVFDHKKHFEDYKVECQACHHDRERATPITQPCSSCHGVVDKPGFKEKHVTAFKDQMSCTTCHHVEFAGTDWDHAGHQKRVQDNCTVCHHGDERSQPQPRKCSSCHTLAAEGKKPAVSVAAHARCATAGCHADWFAEGSGMKNCSTCHSFVATRTTLRDKGWITINPTYANCTVCHTEQAVEDLIPGRMQAFHGSCQTCHEQLGKGPFGQQSCNQCHTK